MLLFFFKKKQQQAIILKIRHLNIRLVLAHNLLIMHTQESHKSMTECDILPQTASQQWIMWKQQEGDGMLGIRAWVLKDKMNVHTHANYLVPCCDRLVLVTLCNSNITFLIGAAGGLALCAGISPAGRNSPFFDISLAWLHTSLRSRWLTS